jgi:transglutaminase-like putative cysteine protease
VAEPAIDGDPVTGNAQRTVHLQRTIDDPTALHAFRIVFEFTTNAYYPNLADRSATPAAPPLSESTTYLLERPPHIVFTSQLRAKTTEVVGDDPDPLSRARKIFYWIDENLRWTPEEEYCIIPNLSMHGLARGKGDCGVASMLFITMCRIAGVPARWQSGWTTNPVGWNMHDWAEIYVQPWGWLPVDASYGRQKHDDPAVRDFYFGHADSHRLIVNLDYGRELDPPKRSLRSEPLDFQRGEVELDGRNLYFDDWDYDIEFEREPGP